MIRGEPNNKGPVVKRRWLKILGGSDEKAFKTGSGRLDLANEVAHKDNPLTARVFVNRVWGWHFGQGLVDTPSDFGTRGGEPSNPALLDWLAHDFVARAERACDVLPATPATQALRLAASALLASAPR